MNDEYNILAIIGPTACGKTRLAVNLAIMLNGEIISGDSRQVYRGMDIGTGKDINEYHTENGCVNFHLIDIADPSEDYNLFRYVNDFNNCFEEITARKKLPVLCGGSGLYIEAALKGYSMPDVPEDKNIRSELENLSREELADLLKSESPEIYKKTDISSSRRIIRGIEIAKYADTEITTIHHQINNKYRPLILGINFPRDEVVRRIDARLESRLKEGMIDEVEGLMRSGVSVQRLIKLGLEYRYCAMYINNEIKIEVMIEKLRTEIHRFAKRQMTWFRGMERRGLHIHWINDSGTEAALKAIKRAGFI